MPTKHRRHAITETPRVKEALDPLRAELNGERLDLGELVVLGAQAKLADLRVAQEDRIAKLERLAEKIRRRELDVDPVLADEAKRSWIRG
ncbi:MAG: hypothetical protein H0U25_03315 [Thermoleophilaceae bacterium]|nr:hypothetical protein [Thermoleophilaceae bacterium]